MNATQNATHSVSPEGKPRTAADGHEGKPRTAAANGSGRGTSQHTSPVHDARTITPAQSRRPNSRGRPRRVRARDSAARLTASTPHVTGARRAIGQYGEDLAARHLISVGMRILHRNWRCQEGEVDIVAADGDALVLCEVKARRAGAYEHPMAAVRPEKAARLRRLAERWLEQHGGPPPGGVRIDVIGVLLPARGAPLLEHVRGVS